MRNSLARHICRLLIACMGAMPFGAYADMIRTDQVAASVQAASARDKLRDVVSRSEVRAQLQVLGISPDSARARVSALTDSEVASIAGRIDSVPAGGVSPWAVAAALLIAGLIFNYWVK
ncbi:MAG: PA2779 family protein [Burkholderiales bacterium]|nr:PA2779 family protein [Burkholderiales bacterium]